MRFQLLLCALALGGCSRNVLIDGDPSIAAMSGSIDISVSGLPPGFPAQLSVRGPDAYHRTASASMMLDSLPPGTYYVHAASAVSGNASYRPLADSQSINVSAGSSKTVQVVYAVMGHASSTDLPAHPRVWVTPTRLATLKAQVAANTIRWQRVKSVADAEAAKAPTDYTYDSYATLPSLGLAYLGTGNAVYAQRCGTLLHAFLSEPNNILDIQSDVAYKYRFILPAITAALDWCYDGLTVTQRQQAATWLMDRADWVWPETNAARAGAWGTDDPGNNYWWGFMMTGPAALAAAGDDIGTGTVSGTNRPAYHAALALQKWNGPSTAYFGGEAAGGAFSEGTNYGAGSSWFAARFADAFRTAGTPLVSPWLEATLRWNLASSMPGGNQKAPLGDQSRESSASEFIYDRIGVLDLVAAAGIDNPLKSQVQSWLNLIGQTPTSELGETMVLADELLHYDPAQPASDLNVLPKDYLAAGAGYFVYRQNWTDPNATALVLQCGPIWQGHSSKSDGGLMIWKGGSWVSASANLFSASGIEQETYLYNTLTVGSVTQSHTGSGHLSTPQVSDALVAMRCQSSAVYGTAVPDALRTVAYLPQQDAFVIVDRVTSANAALDKTFRWQVPGDPTSRISGNAFVLENPSATARCFGNVLAPATVTLGVGTYALGNTPGQVTSRSVNVIVNAGRAADVVVTVLQCTTAAAPPAPAAATVTSTAAVVTIGTSRVTIPLNETQLVALETAGHPTGH